MTQSVELYRLVINNLKVLEEAPKIAEEIGSVVFAAIDRKVKEWAGRNGQWDGIYEYMTQQLTIKDAKWGVDNEGNYDAYYTFGMRATMRSLTTIPQR